MIEEHVFVSVKNREVKARKMESVLLDFLRCDVLERKSMLDIGCGIGQIAEYFSHRNDVVGADVHNRLLLSQDSPLRFTLLTSETLPFNRDFFDIVITNHVIEHIRDQNQHLREIQRVLKPGGICYLATPNWNFPVEPHYRIPFIHYFPAPVFHGILRLLGMYKEDLFLLSHRRMLALFAAHGFEITEYTGKILQEPERFHLGIAATQYIPNALLGFVVRLSPTNIFILRKAA